MRALWALLSIVVLAGRATAQPALPLSVTREAGAESCPDARVLLEHIARIRSAPARADQPAYRVLFTRDGTGLRAELIRSDTAASRVLTDQADECAGLAQATAVTLALLFDADASSPEPLAPAPVASPSPPVAPVPVRDAAAALRSAVALGAGGLFGVTRSLAPAATLELDLRSELLRVALGALYAPPLEHAFAGGHVGESLAGGSLHACIAPLRQPLSQPKWRLDACAGAWLGALHARARGFDDNGRSTRLWSALGLDARLSRTPAPFGAELALSLLVPLRRQDFEIDNAGVAYASRPIAVLVTLRGALGWAW